jgi:hypothetical protein
MKNNFSFYILALFVFLAASVVAVSAAGNSCNLQGVWINFDENGIPGWVSTSEGQSASFGTNSLEYPFEFPKLPTSIEPPFDPIFDQAVGMTQMRGIWKRAGGTTFNYTMIGYGYDLNGFPIYINKMSGTLTLSEDCNSTDVSATLNIFICQYNPGCPNPMTDTPDIVLPVPNSVAYRLLPE